MVAWARLTASVPEAIGPERRRRLAGISILSGAAIITVPILLAASVPAGGFFDLVSIGYLFPYRGALLIGAGARELIEIRRGAVAVVPQF